MAESSGDIDSQRQQARDLDTHTTNKKASSFICSWRFVITLLLHTTFTVLMVLDNSMAIAVVCMASTTKSTDDMDNGTSTSEDGGRRLNQTDTEEEFSWDSEFQGLILSAASFFSWAAPSITMALQPYMGFKTALCTMTVMASTLTLLTPIATRVNLWLLFACRVLIGATIGSNVPVIGDFIAWWAPANEKQTMVSITFSGFQTGSILASFLPGYLCTIPVDNGWPFIFYVSGSMCLAWALLWQFMASRKPEDHKYISRQELDYIQQHRQRGKDEEKEDKTKQLPYKAILTSVPVVTFLVCSALHYWSISLLMTYQGVFLADVLNFSTPEAGVLMSISSGIRFVSTIFWTALYNRLRSTTKLSNTAIRKICIFIGMTSCAGAQITVVFLSVEERWFIVAMIFLSQLCQGVLSCLLLSVPQDIAPRYAGFITGQFFTFGGLFSISAPIIVASLTPNNEMEEWDKVWILLCTVYLFVVVTFLIFGDSSLQPWATDGTTNENPPDTASPFENSKHRRLSSEMSKVPVALISVARKLPTTHAPAHRRDEHTSTHTDDVIVTKPDLKGIVNFGFESDVQNRTAETTTWEPNSVTLGNRAPEDRPHSIVIRSLGQTCQNIDSTRETNAKPELIVLRF